MKKLKMLSFLILGTLFFFTSCSTDEPVNTEINNESNTKSLNSSSSTFNYMYECYFKGKVSSARRLEIREAYLSQLDFYGTVTEFSPIDLSNNDSFSFSILTTSTLSEQLLTILRNDSELRLVHFYNPEPGDNDDDLEDGV